MKTHDEKGDHTHVIGVSQEGNVVVERFRDGVPETAIVRPFKSGRSFLPGEELVRLVADEGGCYRCEPVYSGPETKGPARVTSEEYRSGWDAIWSKGSQAVN